MKFNVYRAIHSQDDKQWQLISVITADSKSIANARASFISSFHTWDGVPGIVIDADNEHQPKNITTATNIDHISASASGNNALQHMKNTIDEENSRHHQMSGMLKDQYNSMLETM